MRKFLIITSAAIMFASCAKQDINQGIHPMTPAVNLHKVDDGVYPAVFSTKDDGNYHGMQLDDHSTYTQLGKTMLMLADDFTIIDCGDNPEDANDIIRTNQKQYLEGVKEYKRDFSELNTLVTVKEGIITKITRRWIP